MRIFSNASSSAASAALMPLVTSRRAWRASSKHRWHISRPSNTAASLPRRTCVLISYIEEILTYIGNYHLRVSKNKQRTSAGKTVFGRLKAGQKPGKTVFGRLKAGQKPGFSGSGKNVVLAGFTIFSGPRCDHPRERELVI
jgi:hypothetical protein